MLNRQININTRLSDVTVFTINREHLPFIIEFHDGDCAAWPGYHLLSIDPYDRNTARFLMDILSRQLSVFPGVCPVLEDSLDNKFPGIAIPKQVTLYNDSDMLTQYLVSVDEKECAIRVETHLYRPQAIFLSSSLNDFSNDIRELETEIKKKERDRLCEAMKKYGEIVAYEGDKPVFSYQILEDFPCIGAYVNGRTQNVDIHSVNYMDGEIVLHGYTHHDSQEVDISPLVVFTGHLTYIINIIES